MALDLEAWTAPGEPVSFAEAMAQSFEPIAVGQGWARPWGTTWLRMRGTVPAHWVEASVAASVDIGFTGVGPGFTAEAMFWNHDGSPRSGLHPERRQLLLDDVVAGDTVELILEAAANPPILPPITPLGAWETAGDRPFYTLRRADLVVRNPEVEALVHDLDVLSGLMRVLALDDPRRTRILRSLERAIDALDLDNPVGSAGRVRAMLQPALAVRARDGEHTIIGVGHAHIDSAWLWPIRETMRKCARTFTNAVDLMDSDTDYVFVCSQAQQFAWIEEQHPALFERIRQRVADGRFVPVGGMWVEADMNLPSGESIARQLVYGQRYFESRFGLRCREVWIPDVFGYPGSLPQIFAAGGCDRFVTQKLSWNKQNRLPHHTFRWTGIDGTSVLTHFPPIDSYNALVIPKELAHAVRNFRDHAWSTVSLMPYGHGDGGGGPTREMVERAHRLADLDGMPRVQLGTVDDFFARVEADIAADPAAVPEWRGELYFEMHRGTYTSQSNTKIGNRRAEHLLREAELWHAYLDGGPRAEIEELWKTILLLQFHDIIPGSSIAWVYEDAERDYARVNARLEAIVADALRQLAPSDLTVANAATHARDEIIEADLVPTTVPADAPVQVLASGRHAVRVRAPGLALGLATPDAVEGAVELGTSSMSNGLVSLVWDELGRLTSVRDERVGRELLRPGALGAEIELAPDFPNEYDAWDLESWARRNGETIDACDTIEIVDGGPLVGRVRVTRTFDASTIAVTYVVRAMSPRIDVELSIDWHHRERLLSIAFPWAVHADVAHCDIQFGHVARPTHRNTSWDAAKFEVCAHRWVDVSEPGFGVAVLNDGRYGHSVSDGIVRVSLQRGARFPDPMADDGHHDVRLAVFPHGGDLAAVAQAAEGFNLPLRVVRGVAAAVPAPLVTVDAPNVLVSAVKQADAGADLVVRMWEAIGARATVTSLCDGVVRTNLLEEPIAAPESAPLELRPFELITLQVRR